MSADTRTMYARLAAERPVKARRYRASIEIASRAYDDGKDAARGER